MQGKGNGELSTPRRLNADCVHKFPPNPATGPRRSALTLPGRKKPDHLSRPHIRNMSGYRGDGQCHRPTEIRSLPPWHQTPRKIKWPEENKKINTHQSVTPSQANFPKRMNSVYNLCSYTLRKYSPTMRHLPYTRSPTPSTKHLQKEQTSEQVNLTGSPGVPLSTQESEF